MSKLRLKPRGPVALILSALLIAVAVMSGSIYRASGTSHDTTYYACLYAGSLSQVGTSEPANCGRGRVISWVSGGDQSPVSWNDLTDIPPDFQDGSIAWSEVDCPEIPGEGGCIRTSNLHNNAVTSDKINDGTVASVDLAPSAVVGGPGGVVMDGTISSDDLAPNAVAGGTGGVIVDGSITSADLAPGSVSGGPGGTIEDGSITADDLAGGSVPTSKTVANAAQGSSPGAIIGGNNAIDTTATAVINIQDSVNHTVLVTAKAYLQCIEFCDPDVASVEWFVRAFNITSGTTVIAGTYTATVSGTGDVLTVVETTLHTTAQGPTEYTLHIRAPGDATYSVYGMTVTAVDMGRTPTP